MLFMSFRENLKDEMEYQGITLKELSAQTAISKGTLSNYLKENCSVPAADVAVKIAQALGVTVEYLVLGETTAKTEQKDPIQNSLSRLSSRDREIVSDLVRIIVSKGM